MASDRMAKAMSLHIAAIERKNKALSTYFTAKEELDQANAVLRQTERDLVAASREEVR